jgi:hypothetical protein
VIQRLQCRLATHGAGRGEARCGSARSSRARLITEKTLPTTAACVFRGFCVSTAPAWGKYAMIDFSLLDGSLHEHNYIAHKDIPVVQTEECLFSVPHSQICVHIHFK